MKKLLLSVIALSCLTLCGCCGSNGDSGNALTPEQQEFAEIGYEFQAAMDSKDKNIDKVKKWLYSDGVYNNGTYEQFFTKLVNFFNKAENIHFNISDIGLIPTNLDKQADVCVVSLITNTYKGEKRLLMIQKFNPNNGLDVISAFPLVIE